GYRVRSHCELRLPQPVTTGGQPDLTIVRRQVRVLPPVTSDRWKSLYVSPFRMHGRPRVTLRSFGRRLLLEVVGVGLFVIGDRSIHFYSDIEGGEYLAEKVILGTVLTVWLEQRGHIVLHAASVIDDTGGAIAFCGDSGAGKSTTARSFTARGYKLVTDDLLVIGADESGYSCRPGVPYISLTPVTHDWFSKQLDLSLLDGLDDAPKRYSKAERIEDSQQPPLKSIFILNRNSEVERCAYERLRPAAALIEMLKFGFAAVLMQNVDPGGRLRRYGDLVSTVPVYRLDVPDDMDRIDELERVVRTNARCG
ncbi:MAG: hypothetical protein DWQ08_03060, partial [Proteobacteria bacterium]